MKYYKQTMGILVACLLQLSPIFTQTSAHGLRELSDQEKAHLENNVPKAISVKPNALSRARIRGGYGRNTMPLAPSVFHTVQASSAEAHALLQTSSGALPLAVNNSLLACFPPIGNQGNLGACVAFGSTYYQATHEVGLLNGINNKTSFAGVLSPKWTYDLLNGGQDNGLSVTEAFLLLGSNGAVSIQKFPYDTNYTAWDLNAQDWISSLSNRLAPAVLIPGLGGSSTQNLTAIKQALANGHVLTFATYIDSWQFTQIKQGPSSVDNTHVGEWAAVYMNGESGGHYMTIVGYNDNLWIDVNNNGSVDAGEMGAFLIANSWGDWGNNGFIWISYDAFKSASGVAKGPNSGRVAAGIYLNSCLLSVQPKAKNYTPSLVAQFTLSQTQRNQINVLTGVSLPTQTAPSQTTSVVALASQGGAFDFAGQTTKTAEQATFAADLTDFIASLSNDQRYYLSVSDSASGNPTVLSSYSLIDLTRNHTVAAAGTPVTYDHTTGLTHIDYNFQTGLQEAAPTVAVSAPLNGSTVHGTVVFSATPTVGTGVAQVAFAVNGEVIQTVSEAPYQVKWNTKKVANGSYRLTATVTDTLEETSQSTITVKVSN